MGARNFVIQASRDMSSQAEGCNYPAFGKGRCNGG